MILHYESFPEAEAAFEFISESIDAAIAIQSELAEKQARIDALMLEYCPGDMSDEQVAEWGKHQVPAPYHLQPTATTPDADGWIEWKGGECPVGEGLIVKIRLRDLCIMQSDEENQASDFCWKHNGRDWDIIAYSVVA